VQTLGLLDSPIDCVCEGGGVLYQPRTDRYELLADAVDRTAVRSVLPAGSFREELGKLVCYSVYPEPGFTVDSLYGRVTAADLPEVEVTRSAAAVDVTPKGVDKAFGVTAVLDKQGVTWSEVLAIGDSWNDIPMLRAAGHSACPANAVPDVRELVDYVSPYDATRGITDIIRWAATIGGARPS
jgi:hypothetical protein